MTAKSTLTGRSSTLDHFPSSSVVPSLSQICHHATKKEMSSEGGRGRRGGYGKERKNQQPEKAGREINQSFMER